MSTSLQQLASGSLLSRRRLLSQTAGGFGMLAAADLLARQSAAGAQYAAAHHAPRAKRVIFLFMHGGPSQVDTFEYKPRLQQDDGRDLPFEAAANIDAVPKLLASPWKFQQYGETGKWVSELLPHMAAHVDDMCFLHGLHSRGQSHGQAVSMIHTGSDNQPRPSMGSWVSYGLGAENRDLPAFVSISPPSSHGGPRNYGTAFLPAMHQATTIGRSGKLGDGQIAYLGNPGKQNGGQREQLQLIQELNHAYLDRLRADQQVEGSIEAFELAFRMQRSLPQVLDLSQESHATQSMYGIGTKETDNYGRQCLLARRLAEAGVRYIQVSTGYSWDQHSNLKNGHEKNCLAVDRPVSALLVDLKQRGLLDDTLVLWGGEFGRTPIVQGSNGRDHNPQGFTMWMAGGGVKPGCSYGATDEYGYYAAEDRVHMHDLHATILHLLGLNHERLTYRYAGRDFRLTDVYGRVVSEIIA